MAGEQAVEMSSHRLFYAYCYILHYASLIWTFQMRFLLGSLLAIVSLLAGVLAIYKDREFIPQLACSIISLVGESSYCPHPIPPTHNGERKIPTEEELRLQAQSAQIEAESAERRKLEAERAADVAEQRKRDTEQNPYYFVWDTRPPDDWLSLWERPYANGRLIKHMRNGTALELLEKGPDKWYKFRTVKTGEVGWTAWGNDTGSRIWIYCCRTLDPLPSYPMPYRG
jgi:hypothetical protein